MNKNIIDNDNMDFVFEDMNEHGTIREGWLCPKCGRVVSPDYKTCPYCSTIHTNEGLEQGQQIICD